MQEMQELQVGSLGWEDPLEKGMATHFSILAWETPYTDSQREAAGEQRELSSGHRDHQEGGMGGVVGGRFKGKGMHVHI